MTFGKKIKEARLALTLSQTELSALTGISERSLYTYEQLGTIPRKSNIEKLAEALHVTTAYLLNEQETDPGKNFEEEAFLRQARQRYGTKGKREAQNILKRTSALFAGGELDEAAKHAFMDSLMKVYLASKAEASEKFTSVRNKELKNEPQN